MGIWVESILSDFGFDSLRRAKQVTALRQPSREDQLRLSLKARLPPGGRGAQGEHVSAEYIRSFVTGMLPRSFEGGAWRRARRPESFQLPQFRGYRRVLVHEPAQRTRRRGRAGLPFFIFFQNGGRVKSLPAFAVRASGKCRFQNTLLAKLKRHDCAAACSSSHTLRKASSRVSRL